MSPRHHPPDELLVAYAAGTLPEAPSLIVATHLALCPHCRAEVRRMEAVGGALLDDMPAAPVGDDLLAAVMAQLDAPVAAEAIAPPRAKAVQAKAAQPCMAQTGAPVLPQPLRGYVGCDLDGVAWTGLLPGIEQAVVPVAGAKTRLLRVKGGIALPRHTHTGTELTLVLSGAFTDETGRYARGDFAALDSEVDHKPMADPAAPCVCLAVTDAPLRLTGPIGRLFNPFVKF